MPMGSWVVESVIRFTSNGVSTMERISAATNTARIREGELRGEITAQEGAWLRLQSRIRATNEQRIAMFSAGAGSVALGGAAIMGFSIDQAANMERSMLNLQIATHSSKKTMDAFRESIYQTAFATAQSAPDIASIYGTIASTSGLPAKSLTPQFMSMVTKFGEIIQMKSAGTAHEYTAQEAAMQAIELAHQYRAYTPQQIGPFLEMLHRAVYFMPGGLSQFVTQSKYYAPLMAMSAGNVDAMQQSIDLGILLQQTGLGRGKGGTGVAAFEREILQGLSMTKFSQGGRHKALMDAGLIDKTGNTPFMRTNAQNQTYFDIIGALAQVQKYADAKTGNLTGTARSHAEETVIRTILSALGINGSLIAMVAAGGGNLQMHNVREREKLIPSIAQDQAKRLQTFWMALQRDERGISSLAAALGGPALKEITPHLTDFANALHTATIRLERDPKFAGGVFNGIAIGTGIAALGAGARIALPALKFIGGGLLDIGKGGMKAAGIIDRLFMRGVGQEMVGTITEVARDATAAAAGVLKFSGAIGTVAEEIGAFFKGWNVWLDAFMWLNDASAQGPKNGSEPDWIKNMTPAQRAGRSAYMLAPIRDQIRDGRKLRGGTVFHIQQVTIQNPEGKSALQVMQEIENDPRHKLGTGSFIRTHPYVPAAVTHPTQ